MEDWRFGILFQDFERTRSCYDGSVGIETLSECSSLWTNSISCSKRSMNGIRMIGLVGCLTRPAHAYPFFLALGTSIPRNSLLLSLGSDWMGILLNAVLRGFLLLLKLPQFFGRNCRTILTRIVLSDGPSLPLLLLLISCQL